MTVMYRPATPMPAGYRGFADVVREIAEAEGWTPTGFHFCVEPTAADLERIAEVHFSHSYRPYNFPVEALHVRKIEYTTPCDVWTVFRSAPTWWEGD